jgi:DNA-binding MarR family transcriptional regulator
MKEIYDTILKIKHFCICNESKISSSCHIGMAELKGINALGNNENITCTELAKRMDLSLSRGSRIIDNLVKKGYLLRKVKDHDRRFTLLYLTEKGKELKNDIIKEQKAFEENIYSEFTAQEIESIKRGLKLLEKFLVYNKKGDKYVRKNISRSQ